MFENKVAQRMSLLRSESAFTTLAKANMLEAEGRSIIHLEIGQPDFKTPENIIDAADKALREGKTGYTAAEGILPLREAIAEHCRRYKNVDTNADEIVVVPGGKPIMFYTMLMLCEPGDEVIYPNPGFPIFESLINYSGAKAVPMPLKEQNNFMVDLEQLARDINERTKLIIINNPGNPTGSMISNEDIQAIADLVRGKGIFILSDETYDRITFEEKPLSIASLPGMKDHTIILDGFSKTYSMTGWRLGYGVLNKELAEHMSIMIVNSNSCTATMTQWAGVEALNGPQETVSEMIAAFRQRRDYLIDALNQIDGVSCNLPKGAFYAFPNISSFGLSSDEFASRLLQEGGVATLSGSTFGEYGEGCLRISYANSLENLKIAVERIDSFTKTLK